MNHCAYAFEPGESVPIMSVQSGCIGEDQEVAQLQVGRSTSGCEWRRRGSTATPEGQAEQGGKGDSETSELLKSHLQ